MFFCTWHVLINFSPIRLTRTLNPGSIPTPLCDNGTSFREVEIVARERFIFELACALIVLGRNFDNVRNVFTKERKMIPKQINIKERKTTPQIAPKRSAVISNAQKDSPYYRIKVSIQYPVYILRILYSKALLILGCWLLGLGTKVERILGDNFLFAKYNLIF